MSPVTACWIETCYFGAAYFNTACWSSDLSNWDTNYPVYYVFSHVTARNEKH